MTPVFCCGFECGGGHWNLTGTTSYATTSPINGLRSGRINPTASAASFASALSYGAGAYSLRFNINFTTLPNVDVFIGGPTLTNGEGAYFKASDGKIYAGTSTSALGATGVSVSTGVVYAIDVRVNRTANPWLVDVQVDGSACGQCSTATAGSSVGSSLIFGDLTVSVTADYLVDDVILTTATADYPIGIGKVLGFVPSGDGTHTCTTTTIVKGTTAAPTTGGNVAGSTDSFNWVNARPIGGGATDATRLINQQTAGGTLYAEWTIEQTTETAAPRAVEVLCIAREASTTGCNSTFKVNDNGTENTVYAMTTPAGNSDEFKTKQYALMPADNAAWTLARFKGLRLRFGYSTDATPDVYCRGWMVEAEFAIVTAAQTIDMWGLPTNQPVREIDRVVNY